MCNLPFSRPLAALLLLLPALLAGCHQSDFPRYPSNYREYAYVTNGGSNTVTVLDLVNLRQDRELQVGEQPTGITANPVRNEVYAVNSNPNSGMGSVSVINAETNKVTATIPVRRLPYFIAVDAQGKRGYVANSGSNNISVLDLVRHREIAVVGAGEQPGMARIAPDGRTLVVTNRGSGSVSIYTVSQDEKHPLQLRAAFDGCPGATDAVILPDSSKTFVACSAGHQVMAIALAAAPDSYEARQSAAPLEDHLLALLDVGKTPIHLALKPDGGEIFVSNFDSGSISEIATGTNEVGGTYMIGSEPVTGIVSADNSMLWVSNFGADSVTVYSIDDGQRIANVRTGAAPDALAFSTAGNLLFAVDTRSGDVAVIRTQQHSNYQGRSLFTMLPAGVHPNAIAVKSFSIRQ
ncbi:MAG: lactonase family protein [Acidobacteriaceae bacterium]